MMDRYEHLMSALPRGQRRLLFHEGRFSELPREVRAQGVWTGSFTGEIVRLKPQYRLALARDGYVLVYDQAVEFEPEVG